MSEKEALIHVMLRLGDTALIHGQRLAEWCSKGPILEEDLALTNLALDNIGKAQHFLQYAADLEGKGQHADDLAFNRDERHFYNYLMVELPNGDFTFTVVRLLLISKFECLLYDNLSHSKDEHIQSMAIKALKESKYHFTHASSWTKRLGLGTVESNRRMKKALHELWMFTGELFDQSEEMAILMAQGLFPDMKTLHQVWKSELSSLLKECELDIPNVDYMQTGGAKGVHTEYLGHILTEMQYLRRAYPDAKWL